jgi:hypothetical protein
MQVFKALGQIVVMTCGDNEPDSGFARRKRIIDANNLVIADSYSEAIEAVAKHYSISGFDAVRLVRNCPLVRHS